MEIVVTPLEKALDSLRRGIERSVAAPDDEELRDAVIQRFEYTIDLSWKFMQRYLKTAGVPETDFRTKRDLFREAAKIGLITNPEKWFAFYEARNETSHTYNANIAEAVYEKALEFHTEAHVFLDKLKQETAHD